ncbi:MAG: bifunctional non-ous end joining protein LigD [Nocardioidaceae bacterium]|nr:bifunctional non-ous end joining protein LigD [Nocardioidaceae bacterium]
MTPDRSPARRREADRLDEYRRRRDPKQTPEPVPAPGPLPTGNDDTFVIQEHHATALHWDFRLERDGVLVSWAVPKGLPTDRKTNHLAVHTEDHPLDYAAFEGAIPAGEYGGGKVRLWDRGTYETQEWTADKVKVTLHGSRAQGKYVLFHTDGKNWMIHRMDDAPAGWSPMPARIAPMLATPSKQAPTGDGWAYEMKWDGIRVVAYVDGGRITLRTRSDKDVTGTYPELRRLGEDLGATQAILDGEVVAFDESGKPSFGRLQQRMGITNASQARRLASTQPVVYIIFDVMHLDGRSTLELPYTERREILEGLGLAGPTWQTPPALDGDGEDLLLATREQGLEGILAKRRNSTYQPGVRSKSWLKVKNERMQEVVLGGWRPGEGRRADTIGALLMGIPDADGLRYVGRVGTGFDATMLTDLKRRLERLARKTSPFIDVPRKDAKDARWCSPTLVGEVAYSEQTSDGRLRHPSWRGLRPDKSPLDVRMESG